MLRRRGHFLTTAHTVKVTFSIQEENPSHSKAFLAAVPKKTSQELLLKKIKGYGLLKNKRE